MSGITRAKQYLRVPKFIKVFDDVCLACIQWNISCEQLETYLNEPQITLPEFFPPAEKQANPNRNRSRGRRTKCLSMEESIRPKWNLSLIRIVVFVRLLKNNRLERITQRLCKLTVKRPSKFFML